MPDWPLLDTPGIGRSIGALTASTLGTTVTAGAANTKGSYAELIASTAQDAGFLTIYFGGGSAAASYLVDIAVGAAGSERIIIPNLMCQPGHVNQNGYSYQFPVFIPAGTRIAARVQSSTAAATITALAVLHDYAFTGYTVLPRIEAFGPNTGTSQCVAVDPGATINTKGAYSQLTASTPCSCREIILAFGHIGTTTTVTRFWMMDLAIGGAGSERIIIENIYIQNEATEDMMVPRTIKFPVSIPEGSRIAVRAQCNDATATARNCNTAAYGIS